MGIWLVILGFGGNDRIGLYSTRHGLVGLDKIYFA